MLSYSHQFAKKLKSTSMSQENTILDACLFRVGKLVRFQSQMHLSKICQVQAPVVQKVDIFVPQRRPAPIVLLSRSSYTKEFTCKLDFRPTCLAIARETMKAAIDAGLRWA